MPPDKLAYMANQIGRFFAHQPRDKAVQSIAQHLRLFWDPRMRRDLLAHLESVELSPLVREAATLLKQEATSAG